MAESISPILRVADAFVALPWYERLGFEQVSVHRFGPGMPVYLIVRRGEVHIHLSEHLGDARPGGLAYLWVDDVDAVAAEFRTPIDDNPWARDTELVDPDGNRIRVGTSPREAASG
jgi:catechol 2,3-dioxygenase-like lactoylglutathione lyase family enzyme